ncbi:single-stranded DNA-binding protein [Staphylococcus haemolyticus]|uniref:single-stranded DNA-binding protein n=1 Tax=Staphylococcus haemolyticus TaxID=1283 RepID=UPI001C452E7F|nr:single-stranded DNA-binding protein [Staphylococcus haemolyticus]MBM6371516.1 single-stranded DNA-binding protein [Staphylococcus epidermidis]HDG8787375.1 single-stranded DNA-binding protein [Staphylococcus aureus]MCG1090283.1 single-stranded DNA-binding protein [Staphylococcus epidermidis]MCH4446440.1 single-stranded DNA-binding protein [Staphylococcus haemolyticus]QXN79061.1 single-stranded DNA-binding protein [Staphylococcus haemolyticus]
MINNVFLLGRIAHDLNYTVDENDLERCTFKIAVNSYNNLTNYPTVTVFGKDAKNLVKYNSKGDLVHVTGYISTKRREKENGEYKYYENIIAQNIKYLSFRDNDTNDEKENHNSTNNETQSKQDLNFEQETSNNSNNSYQKANGFENEDTPF